jgi:hypothetical protein
MKPRYSTRVIAFLCLPVLAVCAATARVAAQVSRSAIAPDLAAQAATPSNMPAGSADHYPQRRAAVQKRDARQRRVPFIPPKDQKLRVIIDTDARNEIDDIWAIALALRCPERFQIEGFVAANYDNENPGGGPRSIETSARRASYPESWSEYSPNPTGLHPRSRQLMQPFQG